MTDDTDSSNNIDRYHPSGMNSNFCYEGKSFSEYILKMREIIEKIHPGINDQNAEEIIDANSPYEWIPRTKSARNAKTGKIINGVLLIHGLFDSPFTMQSIAEHFIKKDFLVRSILLPGHGTVPGDLLDIDYSSWIKATEYGVKSFNGEVENLYICGFSTGGTLALCAAYQFPQIKGLLLFSPAIKLRTQFAVISTINDVMIKTVGGIKWYSRNNGTDYAKYQSFTFNSAHQVYLLSKLLHEIAKKQQLTAPVFMALTADDEILSLQASIAFFKKHTSEDSRLNIYTNQPLKIPDHRIHCFTSSYPDKNILDFSHNCIAISPKHPHYGENSGLPGFYPKLAIYSKYLTKKVADTEPVYYGAMCREHLKKFNLHRLTYNPDFDNLMARVDDFMVL